MTFPPLSKIGQHEWIHPNKGSDREVRGDAKAPQTLAGLVIVKCARWARCGPALGSLRPCLALSWETSYFLSWFLAIYIERAAFFPQGAHLAMIKMVQRNHRLHFHFRQVPPAPQHSPSCLVRSFPSVEDCLSPKFPIPKSTQSLSIRSFYPWALDSWKDHPLHSSGHIMAQKHMTNLDRCFDPWKGATERCAKMPPLAFHVHHTPKGEG